MGEWKTIDSAPKDGTMILVAFKPKNGAPEVAEARWNYVQGAFTSRNGFLVFDTAFAWTHFPPPPKD